ncbi:transposable element Tcb2 transposase [Trichonephila clavipes]|nr:transposable element Tcb2 transposase [Trichonephila clavipes]
MCMIANELQINCESVQQIAIQTLGMRKTCCRFVPHHLIDDQKQFTCRNCGGGDRGRVAIYRPFGELLRAKIVLSPVWCSRLTTGVPLAHATMNFVGLDLTMSDRRRPGAGRPRTTTSTDDRYIQLTARRNRTENATQLQRQLLLARGRRVSSQTVHNRLHEGGLYARRSMVCIPLTPRHRAARRRWAAEHRDWEQHDWSQVLFTDESRFSLECDT